MNVAALALAALLAGASCDGDIPPPTDEGPPFARSPESFATSVACAAHLASLVKAGGGFDRAVGPYTIASGDVRAHRLRARGGGHEIEEYRCLAATLEVRRWSRGAGDVKPFTMDDIGNMSFPQ